MKLHSNIKEVKKMSLQLELPQAFYDELGNQLKDVYAKAISEAKRDFGYAKEFLTIQESLEIIGVSRNTFTNQFLDGGLPQYKIGNRVYIKKSELNQFISNHRI